MVVELTRRIAILFEFPTLNGGERSMLAVLQALRQDPAFCFTAIAPATGDLADEISRLEIPVAAFQVRAEGRKRPVSDLHDELHSIVGDLRPHLLHSNSLAMSRLVGQIDFSAQPALQRTGHLRDIMKLNATVIADLNNNDSLIAVSQATRQFHVNQGLHPERCVAIHNGVDVDLFQPRPRGDVFAELFPPLPPTATVLLNVGQICLRKGQSDLAKAVCRVLSVRDDVHLVVVGERHSVKAESVAFEAAIAHEFSAIGRESHLHLLGYRRDVATLMNAADVLVHPAHQEPFGRTLLEAAASGLPIIATDVGGTSEMLRPNRDAVLLPPGNPALLADAILALLADVPRQQALAESARQRILQQFALPPMVGRIVQFWQGRSLPTLC